LISLLNGRPVTPEAAGSSPVAPAKKINDLAQPCSDWLQNPGRCRYKNSRLSFLLYSAAANLTGCIADPNGSHVDGVVGFMQTIGNGKCVGHLGRNDARGGLAGYHFDRSRPPHISKLPLVVSAEY
jgi:hypothetical protein